MTETYKIFDGDSDEWDALVRASYQGSVFLLDEFQKAWCDTDPSLHVLRFGCFDKNGKLIAGQSIFHKIILGLRVPNTLNIFYSSTPILLPMVQNDGHWQFQILSNLAKEAAKHFPFMSVELHPSIKDARPYLEQGWLACPIYTYTWKINDPDAILMGMNRKRSYVRKALQQYVFSSETGDTVVTDFLRLYGDTVEKFGWRPDAGWGAILRKRIEWMQTRDIVRLFTCRTKLGELIGVVVYILSRPNQTVYFLLIGYDHILNNKEFPPAIHWFAAKELSSEFPDLDFGEAYGANIHAFKDSLGAFSSPFWKLETPNAQRWMSYYNTFAKIKSSLRNRLSL